MKVRILSLYVVLALCLMGSAFAKDVVLPAGTLLTCMMDEPNFSSATASVGDPFLCHPRSVQMFGQAVFPRGAYLVGHLEADKDPGHFWGKGYLKLSFDRIGLANTDLPLPAKVIAVKGYRVDKEGKIIGHGHATRDVVEWMLPPLWPWKVLTLPARGPRPALKGETYVTLRLMDDVTVPLGGPSPGRFGEPGAALTPPPTSRAPAAPVAYAAPALSAPNAAVEEQQGLADRLIAAAHRPASTLVSASLLRPDVAPPPPAPTVDHTGWRHFGRTKPTLFVLKDGTVYAVADYWRDQGVLSYVLSNGQAGSFALRDVDWDTSTQLNSERGVRIILSKATPCESQECGTF
ncbi:MAG TPA: hypothetical protein VKL40_01370 [Candidatus Angelobacter sp.]|nr:hypothetical protein [Candidatus Angelobacter sp.]